MVPVRRVFLLHLQADFADLLVSRGPAARALKPIAGAVSTLVAGGKFTVEIACVPFASRSHHS